MSFDFGSSDQTSDPMADFLAREQANAGALQGDAALFGSNGNGPAGSMSAAMAGHSAAASTTADRDFERGASAFPSLDGEESAPAPAPAQMSFDDDDDLLGGGGAATSAPAPQDGARNEFENKFPDLDEPEDEPAAHAPGTNGFMAAPVTSHLASYGAEQTRSAPMGVQRDPYGLDDDEETEPIRAWREKQEQDIASREATAERKKAETVSKAEQDIDNFYAEYNAKKEKTIAANKEAEAKFAAQRQAELAEGTTWSRVTKLVDLQNSQSKTIARTGPGSSDLTRMKEVLLSLRREGETAPGAQGY